MADKEKSREVSEELVKALKDYRGDWDGLERDKQSGALSFYIHDELALRTGIAEYVVGAHGSTAKLSIDGDTHGFTETIEGPARIIVNKD